METSECRAAIVDRYARLDLTFLEKKGESKGEPYATTTKAPSADLVLALKPVYADPVAIPKPAFTDPPSGLGPLQPKGSPPLPRMLKLLLIPWKRSKIDFCNFLHF